MLAKFQVKWNLAQEFDILCRLCFKISIILCFGQIWSHNLEFSKETVIWHRNILLYVITVLMFIFSFAIYLFGQIWSQKLAKIVSKDCYTCCMPNFSFSTFWNSGTRIRNTKIHSMHSSQTGTFVKEWQFTILATLLGW